MRKCLYFTVLLFIAALLWWLWPKNPVPLATKIHAPSSKEASSIGKEAEQVAKLEQQKPDMVEAIKEIVQRSNVPVEFWGKVLDQDEQPLAGVIIKGNVNYAVELVPGAGSVRYHKFEVETDAIGNFHISGLKGVTLCFDSIDKKGYELSNQVKKAYTYYTGVPQERFKSNASNPVIFHMWGKIGAETLIAASKFYGIVPDGRPYGIDMLKGQKIEGKKTGDISVSIKRPAQIVPQSKYPWSFTIDAVEGGVLETSDEFMYQAPENGYQSTFTYTIDATDPNWRETVKKKFYVKSRNGQVYGRMEVEMMSSYQDKAVFNVQYFVNPAGSRNLEYGK
jgi:hypothetical protein